MSLQNVTEDSCTDAARRLGFTSMEAFFLQAVKVLPSANGHMCDPVGTARHIF